MRFRLFTLFGAKNFGFFEIYGVYARQRERSIFAILCGCLLWTSSNYNK